MQAQGPNSQQRPHCSGLQDCATTRQGFSFQDASSILFIVGRIAVLRSRSLLLQTEQCGRLVCHDRGSCKNG